MQGRLVAAAALALLQLAATPAFAAPDGNYLQNVLDDRGRCLGTAGPSVAMMDCDESPTQRWLLTPGELPGFGKYHTVADGEGICLTAHPDDRKNTLSMEACGQADNQQWSFEYAERPNGGRVMRMSNREAGATRCLEAVQTGMRMTPCSRRQSGHLWQSNYEPTM